MEKTRTTENEEGGGLSWEAELADPQDKIINGDTVLFFQQRRDLSLILIPPTVLLGTVDSSFFGSFLQNAHQPFSFW